MANDKNNIQNEGANKSVNVDELRAQIEAEVRKQVIAEYDAKKKAEEDDTAKAEAKMEKELAKQEKSVKAMLEAEKKVKIFIPENPLNPNEVVPVGLNGVIYAIPVGQEFEVPESIYKIWKYSYDKTREANQKMDHVLNKEIKILE